MSTHLTYHFQPSDELASGPLPGAARLSPEAPLWRILAAIRDEGSISRAAARLAVSYRYLWGYLKQQEGVFGAALVNAQAGQSAQLSVLGERLLLAEQRILRRLLPLAETLAADIDNELLLAINPELKPLSLGAGQEPLLTLLCRGLRESADILLSVESQTVSESLARLNDGSLPMTLIHLPLADERLCRRGEEIHLRIGRHLRLGEHKLVRFVRREIGLMLPAGNPQGVTGVSDLARAGVRMVNRRAGSGTRIIFDELLAVSGLLSWQINGYAHEEMTHLAVAAAIAAGAGNCGFGLRMAAERFGLDFLPLLSEDVFLVCRKAFVASDAFAAIINWLAAPPFAEAVAGVPGYVAVDPGKLISLRQTLPWYRSS
jgi:putative molybdopterin biosynthesis protein